MGLGLNRFKFYGQVFSFVNTKFIFIKLNVMQSIIGVPNLPKSVLYLDVSIDVHIFAHLTVLKTLESTLLSWSLYRWSV